MGAIKLERPYPKQIIFFTATTPYVGYGGSRGGGKSWGARVKAVLLSLNYAGIQILFLRRTYQELRKNHIIPLLRMLDGVASYNDSQKEFVFPNGSRISLGYCKREQDVLQYQGQAYDVIFLEEATQFSEFQFQAFTECNRSSGLCTVYFEPRMYFTCNPGGIGHAWVKRLFIDCHYKENELAADYTFVPAKVYDNPYLLHNSPNYVRGLENLPEQRRKAMLHGNWDVFEGQYFSEFSRDLHVVEPFQIPAHWRRYVAIDYGLDMLACYWIALDERGYAYVYRELYEGRDNGKGENGSGHIVSQAARRINEMSPADEKITAYFAPPDLWNRNRDSGESTAESFHKAGIPIVKVSNNRVMGWLNLKEWLKARYDDADGVRAGLVIFGNCINLIRCLPELQFDSKHPNDCAITPHEITHAPDALRYFVTGRPMGTPTVDKYADDASSTYDEQINSLLGYGG